MFVLIFCVTLLIVLLYVYGTKNHDYWKKRGVTYVKPIPLFGTNLDNYIGKVSIVQIAAQRYKDYPKEKIVGSFRGVVPELTIRDPELIKRILVTDFYHFYPRGLNPHKKVIEPMLRNLFFADGDTWKLLRQRMTPAFSTGKLKAMFPLIVERAERLQGIAEAAAASGKITDVRDLMARYTTDFIGACGFGIEGDALNDENSNFRKLGVKIFTFTARDIIVAFLKEIFSETFKHWKFLRQSTEDEVIELVTSIMKQRNYAPSGRNDFIDLLLELKQKGEIIGDSIEHINSDGKPDVVHLSMDDILLAAQVFVFFAAGFETSSSATSFTLHQLAFNPDVQEKVQQEIDTVLAEYDNKLCYDAVKEMKYLEMAFKEAMRMFPSLGYLIRECARKYTIPETNITLDEGVIIFIPLQAIHNDEQYFEKPDQFLPERFSPENIDNIKKFTFLPFGEGPRACIGERLGLMQSLAGLAAILHKYSVEPAATTLKHPRVDPVANIVQSIKGGLPLTLKKRV